MFTITATVEVTFQVTSVTLDDYLDQNTGEVDRSLLAQALDTTLAGRESHSLTVLTATA